MKTRKENNRFIRTIFGNKEQYSNAICKGNNSKFNSHLVSELEMILNKRIDLLEKAMLLEDNIKKHTLEDVCADIHESWTPMLMNVLLRWFELRRVTVANLDKGEVKLIMTFQDTNKGAIYEEPKTKH